MMIRRSDIAVAFAQAGWHVFPCLPGQKVPATKRGLHAATDDVEHIRRWWGRNPELNVGVACGPSGLLVVDLDCGKSWPLSTPPPKGVLDGSDVLCAFAEDLGHRAGALFETAAVDTPSGGLHLFFKAPAGRVFRNTAGRLGAWIDTRGVGGYVVCPWSSLPTGIYSPVCGFEGLLTTGGIDVAPLPPWLADALDALDAPVVVRTPYQHDPFDRASGYLAAAVAGEVEKVRTAANGTRNDALNSAAFALATLAGLDGPDTQSQLLAAAVAAGLPEGECAATIRSGWTAGLAHPRQMSG